MGLIATVFFVLFIPPLCVQAGSGWDDFTNNLATDLAPIITLFGEQVTKQFLSESLDWLDNLIFALAPIGIITTVVSAIRVCGNSALRAFIGRAQEGPGNVEIELLSSTSETVAELWNEGGIARVFGRPKLLEVVTWDHRRNYQDDTTDDEPTYSAGIDLLDRQYIKAGQDLSSLIRSRAYTAPNLSINKGIKALARKWFYVVAALGLTLQIGVVIYAIATATKPSQFLKNGQPPPKYALYLFIGGTFFLCLGMFLCARLIEQATLETQLSWTNDYPPDNIYWIQPGGQKVGGQVFSAFVGVRKVNRSFKYIRSHRNDFPNKNRTGALLWLSITIVILSFIAQFIGYRGLHSSVTLAQLGSALVMTFARSMLRAQRLEHEENLLHNSDSLPEHELDWFAIHLEGVKTFDIFESVDDAKHVSTSEQDDPGPITDSNNETTPIALLQSRRDPATTIPSYKWERTFKRRVRLVQLTDKQQLKWDHKIIRATASRLKDAIEQSMVVLAALPTEKFPSYPFTWSVPIGTTQNYYTDIELRIQKRNLKWKVNVVELEAMIGLITYSFKKRSRHLFDDDEPNTYIRIIRKASQYDLDQAQVDYQTYIQRTLDAEVANVVVASMNIGYINAGPRMYASRSGPTDAAFGRSVSEEEVLGIRSSTPLTSLIAQTIFISFLSHAVSYLIDIGGKYELFPGDEVSERFSLRNTTIERLASTLSGFSRNSEEALLCVVTALERQGKLHGFDLDLGRDIEFTTDGKAEYALMCYAGHGDVESVRRLLDHDSQHQIKGEWLSMAMMRAVDSNQTAVVKVLLKERSDLKARMALFVAAKRGNVEIVKLFLDNGVDMGANRGDDRRLLFQAATRGNREVVKLLLDYNADPMQRDFRGDTALDLAHRHGHHHIVHLIRAHVARKTHGQTSVTVAPPSQAAALRAFPKARDSYETLTEL